MDKLPVQITVHRVYEDGIVEDLTCPPGYDLRLPLAFVERVIAKRHWVVIVPDQGSGLVAEHSFPLRSERLSEIVSKAISAGQSTVVLPENFDRSGVLPVLRGLSGNPA
ncbi:hypothetical protein [Streptomyces sp. NPDC048638]|uniref:hypothetical protein n=1 Tax=Streptomyces sp. NPDC048638 TaxID=3365580 RepID=UPI0037228660